jgi:hypothetical protein
MADTPMQRIVDFFRGLGARLGVGPKKITIYQYETRLSGKVLPPADYKSKKKKQREEKTLIQWELSFESSYEPEQERSGQPPFFRTLSATPKDAGRRFENVLRSLVTEQERKAQFEISKVEGRIGSFSWYEERDINEVKTQINQKTLAEYLKSLGVGQQLKLEREGKLEVPMRPRFRVDNISFEPAQSIVITSDKIKEGKAIDTFYFKIYRPEEEDEPYIYWRGEYLHDL